MKYTQLPDELDITGYPGSDLIIPFTLLGIVGTVSMHTYELAGGVSSELGAAFKPTVSQAQGATSGTITLTGNQTLQYENRVCRHALYVNGVIYGVGSLLFSRITDEVANTTDPLVLSAGTAQTITLAPVGSSSGGLRAKPFDFRTIPAGNGQILAHALDADNVTAYAFNADGTPNPAISVSAFYDVNNVLDRNSCWLNTPSGGFSGVLYLFPLYLNA